MQKLLFVLNGTIDWAITGIGYDNLVTILECGIAIAAAYAGYQLTGLIWSKRKP